MLITLSCTRTHAAHWIDRKSNIYSARHDAAGIENHFPIAFNNRRTEFGLPRYTHAQLVAEQRDEKWKRMILLFFCLQIEATVTNDGKIPTSLLHCWHFASQFCINIKQRLQIYVLHCCRTDACVTEKFLRKVGIKLPYPFISWSSCFIYSHIDNILIMIM